MMIALLIFAVVLLAYANGANDNFKGVTSLYGSKTCGYRTAIIWATLTTAAGSIAALFLTSVLLKNFSGKGLVPDDLVLSPVLALSVAIGAGGTVLLATRLGFPISTTPVSVCALLGMGTVTHQAKWTTVLPVLASRLVTLPLAAVLSSSSYQLIQFS